MHGTISAGERGAIDPHDRVSAMAAMLIYGTVPSCVMVALPAVLKMLADQHGFSSLQIGAVASAEMAAIMVATILTSPIIGRWNRRQLAGCALAAMIAANVLAAMSTGYGQLIAARILAGAGEGCLLVVMAAATAATRMPDRLFAIGFSLTMTVATLLLHGLSTLVEQGRGDLFFYLFGMIALVGLAVTPLLPAYAIRGEASLARHTVQVGQQRGLFLPIVTLAANFLFWIGIGAIWPMMALIGAGKGLAAGTVTDALANAMIVGIGAGLFAFWLGLKFGRVIPLLVGSAGLVAVMLSLLVSKPEWFWFLTAAFVILWVAVQPYFLGLAAEADPAGRAAGFAITMQYAGLAAGPMFFSIGGRNAGIFVAVVVAVAALAAAVAIAVFAQMKLVLKSYGRN